MPQFDASTFSSQLFWLFICFSTLCFFMARFILPKIGSNIQRRKTYIDQHSILIDNLNSEYKCLEEKQVKLQDQMQKDILKLMQNSQKELMEFKQEEIRKINKEIRSLFVESQKKIDDSFENMDVKSIVDSISKDILNKVKEKSEG
jgi:F-type H+-transporting ATPase subunit b